MLTAVAAGAVAAGAASYLGWATMWPTSQLYGRTLCSGADAAQFALTFDDGPNDPWTLKLLDVLARHDARATFFLIGKFVEQRPDIVRAIAAAGHAIGNHTWSHPNLAVCSPARVRAELDRCHQALTDVLGEPPRYFRPPYGGRRPYVLRYARSLGMQTAMWNVSSLDWKAASGQQVAENVLHSMDRQPGRAPIVLLHDGGNLAFGTDRRFSVEATERLLQRFKGERSFVRVDDLE